MTGRNRTASISAVNRAFRRTAPNQYSQGYYVIFGSHLSLVRSYFKAIDGLQHFPLVARVTTGMRCEILCFLSLLSPKT